MEEVKPKNIFETPQRDERLGWTGDAEIFCRTACFLENTYSFYRKWLRDVEADQTEEGGVAHVVPDIISGNEGDNWLLEQGSHSAAARRFKIPGNTVEFVRDLRYNKYRVFTGLQNEQKKKGCGRMIDIAHAKQEFEKYLDEYDREDEQICLKIVHTYGVVKYAGEIARKMECSGEDVELAELIGLLHDIGKSIDHEVEGTHVQIGVDLCKKYKESATVINAVESHHGDVEPTSLIACLVQAADAISAARPGARRETLETYTNRLKQLEDITNSFKGVEKSFAIQAGREVRVMVVPDQVGDADMVLLARDIAKQIEAELEYPGQIKVSIIRESRAIDYAK